MSLIAGFDYDSKGVFGVVVDELTAKPVGTVHYDLDVGPGDAVARMRRLRDLMPGRSSWEDAQIVAIGIEATYSQGFQVTAALARVQGALIACLPRGPKLYLLTANRKTNGWKALTLGQTNASKEKVKTWSIAHGLQQTAQDLHDAHAIASATRIIYRRENGTDGDDAQGHVSD